MADYEVGNLQIKFSALDEIDFKKISQGLNSVKRAIIGITNIDTGRLDRFSDILSDLSTQFLPFLQGVEKASGGLAVFNDTLRQVGGRGGARGLSVAVAEFEKLKNETRETGEETQRLSVSITDATQDYLAQVRAAEEAALAEQRALEEQRRVIDELTNRYATYRDEFYRASREKPAILKDINTTKAAIQEAQQELTQLKTQFVVVGENLGFNEETAQFAQEITAEIQSMEGVIDNLKVHLADLQSQFGTPFNEAQRAVSALKNELLNVYYATHTINEGQVQEWQRLTAAINETERAVNRALMSEEEKVIADYQAQQAAIRQRIAYLEAALALNKLGDGADAAREELRRLKEEMWQGEKQTKKSASGWKKFLNQIKRIAIYRLIRTALRAIVSTFRDTINAFAEVDDNVNNSMSQITTSLQFIKLGLGSTILPLLQMIAPIVEQIGYSFANLGNMISASLSKDGKFTKINTDAWKDYREEIEKTNSALLDFDKFRVLNRQQTSLSDFLLPNQDAKEYLEQIGFNEFAFKGVSDAINGISKLISEIFETIEKIGNSAVFKTVVGVVTEVVGWLTQAAGWVLDILNNSGLIEPILGGILGYLIAIGVTKIITALSGGKLLSWIGAVVSLLREDLSGTLKMLGGDFVKIISSTKALAAGIGALTGSVLYYISAWKDLNSTQRLWIPLGSALVGIIVGIGTALVLSITAIKEALKLNPAAIAKAAITAALFTAAAGIAIGTAISQSQNSAKAAAQGYAQGGLPDRGTLFYAGEAGAEMVYNMPSRQSGVANISQIEQAFYNALVRYGKENRSVGGGQTVVEIDGQAVFRAVDRAAGQRGLGFARK